MTVSKVNCEVLLEVSSTVGHAVEINNNDIKVSTENYPR